jgi:hypothetical protein
LVDGIRTKNIIIRLLGICVLWRIENVLNRYAITMGFNLSLFWLCWRNGGIWQMVMFAKTVERLMERNGSEAQKQGCGFRSILLILALLMPTVTNAEVCQLWKQQWGYNVTTDPLATVEQIFNQVNPPTHDCYDTNEVPNNHICTHVVYETTDKYYDNGIDGDDDNFARVYYFWRKVTSRTHSATPEGDWVTNQTGSNSYEFTRDCTCTSCTNLDALANPCEGMENQAAFFMDMPTGSTSACVGECEVQKAPGPSVSISFSQTPELTLMDVQYTGAACVEGTSPAQAAPDGVQYSVVDGVPTFTGYGMTIKAPNEATGLSGSIEAAASNLNVGYGVDVQESTVTSGADTEAANPPVDTAATIEGTVTTSSGQSGTYKMFIGGATSQGGSTSTTTTDNGDGTTTTSTTTGSIDFRPVTTAVTASGNEVKSAVQSGTAQVVGAVNTQGTATGTKLDGIKDAIEGLGDDVEFDEESLNGGGDSPSFGASLEGFYNRVQGSPIAQAATGITISGTGGCSALSVDTGEWGQWTTSLHCDTWQAITPYFGTVMLFVWSILGIRIVMSA